MSNFLIIPHPDDIESSLALAEEYGFGFEFNDFFFPDVLENGERLDEIVRKYKSYKLPERLTLHGDFFDVLVFSDDSRIREISELRIRQSIEAALKIGAEAVIFHTNHNPFFTADAYVKNWHNRNYDFWSRILSEYPQVNIYMENMCDFTPDMLAELAEGLKDFPNFGVCFDYAHASVFGSDIDRWVKTIAPYVKHMHINDNDLKNDLHIAVGDGKIDWDLFGEYYYRYFSDVTVLIETSSIENQRRSAEFLKKIGILS